MCIKKSLSEWKNVIGLTLPIIFLPFFAPNSSNHVKFRMKTKIQLQNLGTQSRRRVEGRKGSEEDCPSSFGRRRPRRRKLPLG